MHTTSGINKGRKILPLLLLGVVILLAGCGKENRSFAGKAYHNTTSYFNWYYNATELYRETIEKLDGRYQYPDQGFILPIYFGTETEAKSFEADFAEVARKCDALIYKHPYGAYVDDCWLMKGKTWVLRRNFTLAERNLDYVLYDIEDSDLKAEAWLWKAVNAYLIGNREMAENIINDEILFNSQIEVSDDMKGDLSLFRAIMALDEGENKLALRALREGVDFLKIRNRKARSHFLMAQLYADQKQYPQALEQYEWVIKHSSDYDLVFAAKIRLGRLYVDYQAGKDSEEVVYKYLKKLLKDPKNYDYRDQIYYAYALLSIKKDDLPGALDYLQQSIQVNTNNQRQKAVSYFRAGKIYFEDYQNYTKAQAYYDSAAAVITPNAPEYEEITVLAKTLKDYVDCLNTIQYEDSMLTLAAMPREELDTLINALAEEEKRRKAEEAERMLKESRRNEFFDPLQAAGDIPSGESKGGTWYFDNPVAISNGRIQFEQVWGNIPLEDHWRRRNKQPVNQPGVDKRPDEDGAVEEVAEVDSALLEKYGENYKYYVNIPETPEEVQESNEKIEEAMYNLGQLYYQKLGEVDSAIKTFEGLLDRYDGDEYALRARYSLYQLYSQRDDPLAFVHRSTILSEYPNTIYAYLIEGRDPSELEEETESFRLAYTGLFNAYASKQYYTSVGFSEYLLSQPRFRGNPDFDLARIKYIRAMAYGHLGRHDSLERILSEVVKNYPSHEVTPLAKKTLDYLRNGIPEDTGGEEEAVAEAVDPENERFKGFTDKINPTDRIFVLMLVDQNRVSKSEVTRIVSDFNKNSFPDKNLKVFTFLYQNKFLLPYISQFSKKEDAQAYIKSFKAFPGSKDILLSETDKIFYISHTNFKVAYGQKRMEDYVLFYEQILEK